MFAYPSVDLKFNKYRYDEWNNFEELDEVTKALQRVLSNKKIKEDWLQIIQNYTLSMSEVFDEWIWNKKTVMLKNVVIVLLRLFSVFNGWDSKVEDVRPTHNNMIEVIQSNVGLPLLRLL